MTREQLIAISPFIISLGVVIFSPLLSSHLESYATAYYEKHTAPIFEIEAVSEVATEATQPESIAQFGTYLQDAFQMAVLTALPVLGVLIALADRHFGAGEAAVYAIVAGLGFSGYLVMTHARPKIMKYFRWKCGPYTPVPILGFVVNVVALVIVLVQYKAPHLHC